MRPRMIDVARHRFRAAQTQRIRVCPAVEDPRLRSQRSPREPAKAGRYRQLYDKQYRFERDRFINPGEDFTPEPETVATPARVTNAL